ncbi:MAG: orotate phosphoribosyltransferase [Candidatus Marinimicrobia bacterium]|nr:orotate phosphoribosyltransferase [Candidatus Neomarinimicrobiota bacterium]MDP6568327.1 orotate phosphoribosyltransferase [Candidatus Neomarinimicrobiota bacterium]MDP7026243.1 orotate phosphoribosyltransferase [Candidatus Neomarinimicrobiota bacterium]
MDNLLELMKSSGAVLDGHFLLTSGRHSDVYLEKFRLLEKPKVVAELGKRMAAALPEEVDVVLGAAIGGILLSHATATELSTLGIFAERVDGNLQLRRGFELRKGDRVLIVEDIVSTGGSVKELIELVEQYEAEVAGVVCLVDRTQNGVNFGCSTEALLRYPAVSWKPEECPLCKQDISITTRGRTGKQ